MPRDLLIIRVIQTSVISPRIPCKQVLTLFLAVALSFPRASMGGAFTAIADDASAIAINPARLIASQGLNIYTGV